MGPVLRAHTGAGGVGLAWRDASTQRPLRRTGKTLPKLVRSGLVSA